VNINPRGKSFVKHILNPVAISTCWKQIWRSDVEMELKDTFYNKADYVETVCT